MGREVENRAAAEPEVGRDRGGREVRREAIRGKARRVEGPAMDMASVTTGGYVPEIRLRGY
jgi:hypothetical protein